MLPDPEFDLKAAPWFGKVAAKAARVSGSGEMRVLLEPPFNFDVVEGVLKREFASSFEGGLVSRFVGVEGAVWLGILDEEDEVPVTFVGRFKDPNSSLLNFMN
jgi:hypothetical protein